MTDGNSQDIVRTGGAGGGSRAPERPGRAMAGAGDARGGPRPPGRLPKPYRFRRFWIAFAHASLTAFGLASLALAVVAAALTFAG